MDGSCMIPTIADFYRPVLRKFSPMTRVDLMIRTGATEEAVLHLIRVSAHNGYTIASGHAQHVKPIYYTLTPKGEAAALAMLFPAPVEAKRKITAIPRK